MQPVTVTLPSRQWEQVKSFIPFLESAVPQDKLRFLERTLFKPKKRLRKLQEKKKELVETRAAQSARNAAAVAAAKNNGASAAGEGG